MSLMLLDLTPTTETEQWKFFDNLRENDLHTLMYNQYADKLTSASRLLWIIEALMHTQKKNEMKTLVFFVRRAPRGVNIQYFIQVKIKIACLFVVID